MSSKKISVNIPRKSLNRLGASNMSKDISFKLPKSYLKKQNYSKKKGSNIGLIVIILIIFVASLVGLYFLYKHYTNSSVSGKVKKILIKKKHDGKQNVSIPSNSLPPSSQGHEFNINFWIYINDYKYNYNKDKLIIKRTNGDDSTLVVQLDKETNSLTLKILTLKRSDSLNSLNNGISKTSYSPISESQENFNLLNSNSDSYEMEQFTIHNIELQRWLNINVSLVNNALDVFIDGYLVKSLYLKGLPINSHSNLEITPDGGFNGFVSKMVYFNKALSPSEILSIYKNKP